MHISVFAICLGSFLVNATAAVVVNVSMPFQAPSVAPVINPSLFSLSIEQDRWIDWSGKEQRNEFFYNTLDNLKALTGSPPGIRIGANSEVSILKRIQKPPQAANNL